MAEFPRRQREALALSNQNPQDHDVETDAKPEPDLLASTLPMGPDTSESGGRPLNRQSPFYVGFVGAPGVLVAYGLYKALGQLSQVITVLIVAFFLTLALNPLVEAFSRRGLRRP